LALDINASRLTIVTDCLAIVNDLSRQFAGSYSMVLEEIKKTNKLFELVKFKHENRASNGEAHRSPWVRQVGCLVKFGTSGLACGAP
jgi:hypothetical protein